MTLGQLKQILALVGNMDDDVRIHFDVVVDGRQCVYTDAVPEVTIDAKRKILYFHAEF